MNIQEKQYEHKGDNDNNNNKGNQEQGRIFFGKPYPEESRRPRYYCNGKTNNDRLVTIPVMLEIDHTIYSIIKGEMLDEGNSYDSEQCQDLQEFVNRCFKERIVQILTDPREYGKAVVDKIRNDYCLPEESLK